MHRRKTTRLNREIVIFVVVSLMGPRLWLTCARPEHVLFGLVNFIARAQLA